MGTLLDPRRPATAVLPLVAVAALSLFAGAAASQPPPPNVIVLVADDLGYGDLGAFGSPDARTPYLDALAARGLRLTDFYAGGPICTPSRYALLTGTHAFRAGDPDLLGPLQPRNITSGIDDAATVTVAEALETQRYETAAIGKWHLGHGRMLTGHAGSSTFHPRHHGFDSFFGPLGGTVDYNTHWYRGQFQDWWEGLNRRSADSLLYATHVFGDRAVDYIDAHAGAGTTEPPFFLYLPVTAPHFGGTVETGPLDVTQLPIGEERGYLARFDDLYPVDETPRKRYLAMVAVLDDTVGRIVEALERRALMEHTLIWFLSDNGADTNYDTGSNAPFRGDKGTPYEGGIRVPSFVVWEGRISPGVSDQVAGVIDVYPTLLALTESSPPQPVDGLDLSAFLLGGPAVERGLAVPNTLYGDVYRLGRWKYVRRYKSNGGPFPAELYDLKDDPGETTDLAAVYPDTLALLASLMPYGYGTVPGVRGGAATAASQEASVRVVPNPAAAAAYAELALPAPGAVRVEVLDALGRRLAVLHDGPLSAGVHPLPLPSDRPTFVVVRATGPFGTRSAAASRVR